MSRQRVVVGPWQEPHVSMFARLAIGAAAVVAVAVVGLGVVAGPSGPPGSPTPTASGSPASSATTAQPAQSLPLLGPLAPGRYRSDYLTFTLPAGWSAQGYWAVTKGDLELAPWQPAKIFSDPCHRTGGLVTPGPTVDDLVDALRAQARDEPPVVTDVTISGYAGKQIDLVVPAKDDLAACDAGFYISWIDEVGAYRYNQGPNQHDVLRILNVGGVRVAFNGSFFTSTPIGEREELQSVVDSIEIVPPAPPETTSPSPGQ